MKTIYLNHAEKIKMPILPDKIDIDNYHKSQWTFMWVYHLRELRDVFLIMRANPDVTKSEIYQKVREFVQKEDANKKWQPADSRERDILEYQNALENLNLIAYNTKTKTFSIKNNTVFIDTILNKDLSEQDKKDFKYLFLNFIRFQEILNWFSNDFDFSTENLKNGLLENFDYNNLVNNSKPLYSFNRNSSKSVDTIFYNLENNTQIYTIEDSNKNIVRFWDVFTSISEKLSIANSYSYPGEVYVLNDKTLDYNYRKIRCNYIVNDHIDFNIVEYLQQKHQREKYIRIPDLIKELATQFHYPIEHIRNEIVEQCLYYKNLYSLQRTSSSFIENNELKLFPIVDNYYMSHILLR